MQQQIQTRPQAAALGGPTQYLTFVLGGEMFAIGILSIREILEYPALTAVPMMPGCVRGVINLRGAVVPVIDLSARFGRSATPVGKRSCIVIVEVRDAQRAAQVVGVVVDSVSEVIDIEPGEIEPPPNFGNRLQPELLHGIGKVRGRFVILLDVDHALSSAEIGALRSDALASAGHADAAATDAAENTATANANTIAPRGETVCA